ncbi:hypothetical protein PILCRDRAFT_815876 [Piloderma croceum F 1598]|uniref:Uncharacterized protein n=1 Tax=Piloderma croceum (strain F 1598) TaxID=765440 RepID=A0A0C3CAE6_PILCF|nr:hypothetical protein PILCRDRAFT_815876 [Piloderma croceum F 1598]
MNDFLASFTNYFVVDDLISFLPWYFPDLFRTDEVRHSFNHIDWPFSLSTSPNLLCGNVRSVHSVMSNVIQYIILDRHDQRHW